MTNRLMNLDEALAIRDSGYLTPLEDRLSRALVDTVRENGRLRFTLDKIAEAPGHFNHVWKALEDYQNKESSHD